MWDLFVSVPDRCLSFYLGWEPGPRTSKFLLSYRKSLYIDVCLPAAPNQLLCQQVAIVTMQLDYIAIHIPI